MRTRDASFALVMLLAACSEGAGNTGTTDAATADAAPAADVRDAAPEDGAAPPDAAPPADAEDAAVYDAPAPPDAGPPGAPITAPEDQWTWVPFADSACADGTPTGIGVNLTSRSRRVVIFFNGGGACWDALTCYTLHTASNIDGGYGEANFRAESGQFARFFPFDRTNTDNPWRDASYVFVPYCTGDIHGGDRVATYTVGGVDRQTSHVGYRNVTAYLRRLVATFPMADRVLVTGSSAGGYGAAINWEHIAEAFPRARVDMLDDSGPPLQPSPGFWSAWRAAWDLHLPAGCAECATELGAIVPYYARRFPAPARFALLSYTQDRTISGYYVISGPQFEMQLYALATTRFDPAPNAKYFFVAGSQHVLWTGASTLTAGDGTRLSTWLQQFDGGDAAWRSVRP